MLWQGWSDVKMKGRQSHDTLVRGLIDFFESQKINVKYAKFKGYPKPMQIKRHSPDIIAFNAENDTIFVGEAKMCNELEDQLTRQQFEDFSTNIIESGKSQGKYMPFFIAVPQDCQYKIKETYRQFQLAWRENIFVIGF